MSAFATYSAAVLPSPGKKGILKRLDNKYSEVLIGAVGAAGNGGWIYDERTAIDYMNNNPEFLSMMANRRMRSEWGHPVRAPGLSDPEWFERVCTMLESNWSSHIRKIHLTADLLKDEKGRAVIGIIGEVTPCGPHAVSFERIMDNPDEDLNYSIRSFAKRCFSSYRKHITRIVTFDSVFNPGIAMISKFNTPSMESASPWSVSGLLDEAIFHLPSIREDFSNRCANDDSFEHQQSMIAILDDLSVERQMTKVSLSSAYRF